jgi:DNA polymerase sigma
MKLTTSVEAASDTTFLQNRLLCAWFKEVERIPEVKLRRTAFQTEEASVTLVWFPKDSAQMFHFMLSVNNATAQRNAALMRALAEVDVRAKQLLLLVRRWAKNRNICCVRTRNLPPYAWSSLVVHFLQVGLGGAAVLPALEFSISCDSGRFQVQPDANGALSCSNTMSVADLLTRFFHFYASSKPWAKEALRIGTAMPASDANAELAQGVLMPCLEDPFQPGKDLSRSMTPRTVRRLHKELQRADAILTSATTACLGELLRPWDPAQEIATAS